ncbi:MULTISPECIES: BadF/BadG/BcrA/BcrD ATPase family protein [Arthrobacter]|uniref:BadF/BadG/BcrA/BcrD ATPase family protein n=2 Tax=Arthrobacter TaxID=1663 RepID=A0ABU9KL86_9MICC|nr:BadF/BadG/BcrA/BcrD ATPase family protein [Arthrobacter sp. YJM1]MDP5227660.1 BadF/BadG/BcrA/BcrD ATPase family protein [Arthrobacter sp. YJM1]
MTASPDPGPDTGAERLAGHLLSDGPALAARSMQPDGAVLAADIGKSRCRLELRSSTKPGAAVLASILLDGFPGLATANGVESAFHMITDGSQHLRTSGEDGTPLPRPTGVGAAIAGVASDEEGSRRLAHLLAGHFSVPAAVISDATAAHLGAFGSSPGSAVIIGTGAVVFRFDDNGTLHRADGWGPLLGDRGSGRWIGQEGLSAVLQALDGGPATELSDPGGLPVPVLDLPGWLGAAPNPYRAMGSFTPRVLEAAAAGDAVALDIVDRACAHVTLSVSRALASGPATHAGDPSRRVALLGGVSESPVFRAHLTAALEAAGAAVVPALGSGLDGAAIATQPDLLQERYIYRDQPA